MFRYLDLEALADLGPLVQHCEQHGERFPLLAARLALMLATRAARPEPSGPTVSHPPPSASQGPNPPPVVCGNPIEDLRALCFANVPGTPPEPWSQAHGLLVTALEPAVAAALDQPPANVSPLGGGQACKAHAADGPSPSPAASAAAAALVSQHLSQQWFCDFMARVHLNAFKVDCVLPFNPADLHSMAAAVAASSSDAGQSGSALYLLASMFNHSCDPNVDVTFPENSATAAFVANRDVRAGEQLSITYIDVDAGVQQRRQQLHWAYGFSCECRRCSRELEQAR